LTTGITLAGARFQCRPIEHGDVAAGVPDQPGLLQVECGLGHTFAAHAQIGGDQFLCHDQFGAFQPVQAQQQPAAQLLVQRVVPVAHRGLRHLRDQRLRVAQHQVHGRAAEVELVPHLAGIKPKALAGALNHSAAGRGAPAHEHRDADQAFSAHDGDLTCFAVFRHEQQRHDGGGRKEYVLRRVAGFGQHLAQWHVHRLQLRLQAQLYICGKRGEQFVQFQILRAVHGSPPD